MASLENMMNKEWSRNKGKKNNPMKVTGGIRYFPSLKKDEIQKTQKTLPRPEKNPENDVLRGLNEIKEMQRELLESVADLRFEIIRRYLKMSHAEKTLEKRRASDRIRQKRHKLKRK
jgi:hypothetical protein